MQREEKIVKEQVVFAGLSHKNTAYPCPTSFIPPPPTLASIKWPAVGNDTQKCVHYSNTDTNLSRGKSNKPIYLAENRKNFYNEAIKVHKQILFAPMKRDIWLKKIYHYEIAAETQLKNLYSKRTDIIARFENQTVEPTDCIGR